MQANDSLSLLPVATVFFPSLLAQTSLNAASDPECKQRPADQTINVDRTIFLLIGNWPENLAHRNNPH
jgi:hypothetical protein